MARPLRPLPGGGVAPRRRGSTLQLVLMALGGLVAINLLVVAVVVGGEEEGRPLPPEVESVTPAPNSTIRPQEDVGADLLDDFTGVLVIDGTEIPFDQLTIEPALGQVTFRPGEGKDILRLAPGRHSATVVYWPQIQNRQEAAKSYTWNFIAG